MADRIQTIFETIGIQDAISKINTFVALVERAGGKIDFGQFQASIKSVSKELGTTQAKVKSFISELEQSLAQLKGRERLSIKGKLEFDVSEFISQKTKVESQPVKIQTNFDFSDSVTARQSFAKIATQVREIEDPIQRVKAAQQVINSLAKEFLKIQKDETITAEKRLELAESTRRNLFLAKKQFGIEPLPSGEPIKGLPSREVGVLTKSINATTAQTNQFVANTKAAQDNKKAINDLNKENKRFEDNIEIAIGKLIRYRVAFYTMRTAIQATRDSIKNFIDLQFQLAQMEIVIDRQVDSIQKYREEAFKLGREFGVAIKDVVDVMKIWAQAGLRQNEVLTATKATLVGVNALSADTKEVVEALTAAIFTYGVAVEDNIRTISKWLAVEREFPVSAIDLANSLKVVGAAAQVVGVDLDDLSGFVAAIGSATRKSGTAVGQSVKTLFATLPQESVARAFESLDIAVFKTAEEFRDFDDILFDLSKKWNGLSSVQKSNLSIALGGVRRYSDFVALMDNYNIKLAATIQSQRATNESLQAQDLIINTVKKAMDQLSAAWNTFSTIVGQTLTGPIFTGVKLLTTLFDTINKVPFIAKATGALIAFSSALVGLSIAGIGVLTVINIFRNQISKLNTVLLPHAILIGKAKEGTERLTIAQMRATVATIGLGKAIGGATTFFSRWSILIFGVATLLSTLVSLFGFFGDSLSEASSSSDELVESTEDVFKNTQNQIKAFKQEQTLIPNLIRGIEELSGKINELGKDDPRSLEFIKRLNTNLNAIPKGVDSISNAMQEYNKNLNQNQVNTEGITLALQQYQNTLSETVPELEKLNEKQKENLKTVLTGQLSLLEARNRILSTIEEAVSGKKIEPITLDTEINLRLPGPVELLKTGLIAREGGTFADFAKTLGVERAFELFVETVEGEAEKSREIISDILEKTDLSEEERQQFIIKDKDIRDRVTSLKSVFSQTGEQVAGFYKTTIENILQGPPSGAQQKFLDELIINLKSPLEGINLEFQRLSASRIGNQITSNSEAIRKLDERMRSLKETAATTGDFRIGIEPSNDFKQFFDRIQDLVRDAGTLQEEFEGAREALKFGEVLTVKDFGLEKAIEFIKQANTASLDLNKKIDEMTSKKTALEKLFVFTTDENGNRVIAKTSEGLTQIVDNFDKIRDEDPILSILLAGKTGEGKFQVEEASRLLDQLNIDMKNLKDLASSPEFIKFKQDSKESLSIANEVISTLFRQREKFLALSQASIASVENELEIARKFPSNEEAIINLEKQRLQILKAQAEVESSMIYGDREQQEAAKKTLETITKESAKTAEIIKQIQLDKVLERAVKNAQVLEDSLKGAFSDLPSNILQNAEKRRDLEDDLREAEFELQESRREGDRESITNAQHRVDLVRHEMNEYTRGLKEVRTLIIDIFGRIGSTFWDTLVEEFANSFSKIKIGNQRMGEIIGDAIGRASTQFVDNWRVAAGSINDRYLSEINKIYTEHAQRMFEIFGTTNINTPFGNIDVPNSRLIKSSGGTPTVVTQDSPEIVSFEDALIGAGFGDLIAQQALSTNANVSSASQTNQLVKETQKQTNQLSNFQKALQSGLTLIASTFATAISGTKGQGSLAGSQFGALIGSAALISATTTAAVAATATTAAVAASAAWWAGPLGAIAGGLLGGLLGGLFDSDREPQKPLTRALDSNTEAILSNTIALRELDRSIFNPPTRFSVPSGTGGFGGSVVINISGSRDPQSVAQEVSRILTREFGVNSQRSGSRGFVPV